MSGNGKINPATGKRYNWVDPREEEKTTRAMEREQALLERALVAKKAQDDLLTFTKFTMPDPTDKDNVYKSLYEDEAFHRSVAAALTDFVEGRLGTQQLIFVMPPRHGKTALGTKSMAAWVSGKHPDWDIAVASYSDTMAEDMGADTRAIMRTPNFHQVFPQHRLRRGGNAKSNIQTETGGRLVFVGRGGALTGRGMMLGIGDDIFKDDAEAQSQTVRDAAWSWFTKVFMTRRMGPKLVLLSTTRWHSDDVIGRLTDPENPHYNAIESAKWKIIRLPAIAEDDDVLGRKVGEALWSGRYSLDFLQSQQRLDPLGFSALYQQRPTVADGVLFRRETIQYYTPEQLPANLRIYCASDHAVSTKQRNDPSCFLKIGVDPQDNIYLLECIWKRLTAYEATEAMLVMGGTGAQKPLIWWAERGHISQSIGPFLRKRMLETGHYINIKEVTPVADKQTRAQSIAARVAMGKVYFPKISWWTEKAVNELMAFPNGTHDDFADCCAYIGLGLGSQFGASKPKVTKPTQEGTLNWLKRHDRMVEAARNTSPLGGF